MPAAEYAGDDPDLFAETANFLVIYPFGYLILFKNCLHKFLAIKLLYYLDVLDSLFCHKYDDYYGKKLSIFNAPAKYRVPLFH